jgi:hypothetical protein
MRGLGGLLLLAGICVGLFVYFPAPVDRDTSLSEATRVNETRMPPAAPRKVTAAAPTPAAPSRLASFSPSRQLAPSQRSVSVAAQEPAVTPAVQVEAMTGWQTNVAAAGPAGSLEPTDPESRYRLVVDIQQQLKRVGCYWGRANGAWNNNTREAMREFTTRSNAALPVDKPDYMLLSLLKSHSGRSCGASEQPAITAQARGSKQQPALAAAAPAPEVLPWKAAAAPQPTTRLYTPLPTSIVSTEPLPGRMAIGGPKEFAPAQQAPLVPGNPGAAGAAPGVATATLDPGAAPTHSAPPPAATSSPRKVKKSGSWRRPAQGTPRYNLMLSLGGVY